METAAAASNKIIFFFLTLCPPQLAVEVYRDFFFYQHEMSALIPDVSREFTIEKLNVKY
jgi:hypothetical protein